MVLLPLIFSLEQNEMTIQPLTIAVLLPLIFSLEQNMEDSNM